MENILVIEDSQSISAMIKNALERIDFSVVLCPDFKTAKESLSENQFFAAVVDMELPDSYWEKTADLVNQYNVPIIIYSAGEYNTAIRKRVLTKNILDFIQKKDEKSLNLLVRTIDRLRRNSHMTVLVADDSRTALSQAKFILEQAKFKVLTAADGLIALNLLEKNRHISIVITDYEMPHLNGFELVKKIREEFDSNSMAIIAVSHPSTSASTSKFL
ncbi:MAG: response regulator, partial [Spirochaetaceae bacterium]|nr:response regulator [Spirochaetaceae bacterium]